MITQEKQKQYDVGVIVGRFQVDKLHSGHKQLFDRVLDNHDKVLVFLGLSPAKSTRNNPLDFETRKQMLLNTYPELSAVLYIKDQASDDLWSQKLDEHIDDLVSPDQSVVLYGSRDSFISHYTGRYDGIVLEPESVISGREERKRLSNRVKCSEEFRAGAIWATTNQFPKAITTVDIAIFDEEYKQILLARKPNEDKYRLVGGFAQPGETFELSARREVLEETHLEVTKMQYVRSFPIDDWRYRGEQDKITTVLFTCQRMYGRPTPDDDICELRWFDISKPGLIPIVPQHEEIFTAALSSLSSISS
jgi:bifunctional NMN adenylyltransferase/nudix hydrolase